jgi:uncharacterized membrane protein
MIIILWTIILILSILLIIIGRTFNITMSDVCVPAGWILMFILGAILLFNGVTIATGETETTNYSYNSYNYTLNNENQTDIIINSSTTTRATTYMTVQEGSEPLIAGIDSIHILGFLLVLLGGFGFMTFWFDTKKEKQETQE